MNESINPSRILETGMAFFSSKVLLTAVELDLFSTLAGDAMSGPALQKALGLHDRGVWDFLDALTAMGFLEREGEGPSALYRNTQETAAFLDKSSPAYMGGILEMANARLYGHWGNLAEGLRTGLPQSERKGTGKSTFQVLYEDEARLEQFLAAMTGVQRGNFRALAQKYDFSRHRTLCDVGGAAAALSVEVASHHSHLRCTSFDLPVVEPIARRAIASAGLSDRVMTAAGDFFVDKLPSADVITMGNILHDWNLEKKQHLIRQAYDALPPGGAYIVVENIIDNERRRNAFGLMMSLNMLIETGDGFDYTGADFAGWCEEAGFARSEVLPLAGPCSAAIAYK